VQQAGYSQTNLVSNTASVGKLQILNFRTPGNKHTLVVTIPGTAKNPNGNCSPGCPTGTVANTNGSYFGGRSFIFDTEDGIVANWAAPAP
jgi:hypothetical protein